MTTKSELTNLLLGKLDKATIITSSDGKCPQIESDAIVIDFMSVSRKLSSVELIDFPYHLLCVIVSQTIK